MKLQLSLIVPLTTTIGLLVCSNSAWTSESERYEVSVVGPNVISTAAQEFGATADGKTIYYTYSNNGYTRMTLLKSTNAEGVWSEPEVLPFSGMWNDADPSLSPDGNRLYFISNRPVNGEMTGFLEVWYVDRNEGGWGDPMPVEALLKDQGFKTYPSVAGDGTLYFSIAGKVYLSRLKDGRHQPKEPVHLDSSSVTIAPDQSFMILHHNVKGKRADLAISYLKEGKWSEPIVLPEPINSTASESSPNLAADGKTLYFTSSRLDYSAISWPRAKTIKLFSEAENELSNAWQNGLRNIYKVSLGRKLAQPSTE